MTAAASAGRTGPLHGLKVVELAAIGPVPFACMLFADLGAEVVRVERADGKRSFAEWHRELDRGRHVLALDLKDPAGTEELLRLVDGADVLVEGFRPQVAERLGIGPGPCLRRNPRLVYARMTGWGQDGPLALTPGHDINYLALTGALYATGEAGGPPVAPVNLLGDFGGGALYLVAGVLAALHERGRSGRGQIVDASIVDGVNSLLGMVVAMADAGRWRHERGTNLLDGGAPFYTCYACADGGHVAVGALEDRFYTAFLDGLGLDPVLLPDRSDPANWPALRRAFAGRFLRHDRDTWARRFEDTEACVTPVLRLDEAADHPHQRARGSAPAAPAPRFSRTPALRHETVAPAAARPEAARPTAADPAPADTGRSHPAQPRRSDPRPRP
ncbi:CaiB/BaiF CoA transferase family protein [Actinospica acidiphila]|uniref:CaiB/BaiF CoA transferase family protein n=1 Tax=Actinospica acidiphila TaxID=304899 RepID=UPI00193FB794|nr:CaiB/BaiF CoA-transferase family protein [Actinospica acidiphila]MBM4826665.1 CoA transferase [Actinospica acidiphila]